MLLHPSCGRLTALDTSHRTPPPSLGVGVHFIGGGTARRIRARERGSSRSAAET
jgi:hypothetical protein